MKKSLLDIQQEIRELEAKIADISNAASSLSKDVDALRGEDNEILDYDAIRLMSKNFPFGQHPLCELSDAFACQIYITALLNLVRADHDSNSTVNRLIFVQWILDQSRLGYGMKKLYADSMKTSADLYRDITETIPKKYWKHLIVDSLIVANICGVANDVILLYVANLSGILGIDKDQLRILTLIAKGILKQDLGRMKRSDLQQVLSEAADFRHFLSDKIIDSSLTVQRVLAVTAPDKSHCDFKWKVKQFETVDKGTVLATYREGGWRSAVTEITARCAGTIFQFRHNNTNYGVIAHESDSKDSIKAWAIKGG